MVKIVPKAAPHQGAHCIPEPQFYNKELLPQYQIPSSGQNRNWQKIPDFPLFNALVQGIID